MNKKVNYLVLLSTLFFALFLNFPVASACSRVLYVGSEDVVITGRTMDWSQDMSSNLWSYPRGLKRDGAAGASSINWTSKYGSVTVSGYEVGTTDGMNEKGLVANLLYLGEADYGKHDNGKPLLSIAAWAQYVLDNYATVSEAVESLQKEPFNIVAPTLPNGDPAQLHLSISDPTGDSAIFEYIDGKLIVHHGKQYQIMTNSPKYDDQLALDAYWKSIGGMTFLPGTIRAADRFVRASFLNSVVPRAADANYIKGVPEQTYVNQAVASVMGIMRSVSVPLGISVANEPNIASTLWRTIADQKNKIYYFDSASSPNTFWVPLSELDFKEGSPVKKLTVAGGKIFSGDTASKFESAKPFAFLPAKGV
jgi:penicillin V acylase-like amidase (Ntn superfamily)